MQTHIIFIFQAVSRRQLLVSDIAPQITDSDLSALYHRSCSDWSLADQWQCFRLALADVIGDVTDLVIAVGLNRTCSSQRLIAISHSAAG